MDDIELIGSEFEKRRKLPREVKSRINFNILKNLSAAMIIMLYLLIINITYYKVGNDFANYVKYYACAVAFISVIFFEMAYRKKSLFIAIIGIELLCCGIISVYIPYIYLHTSSKLRTIIISLPAILVVYYFIKSIIIFNKGKKDYTNSLCDVKEILKDEKDSYIDEKSEKTYKTKLAEEKKIKEEIKKEQEIRRKQKNKLNRGK